MLATSSILLPQREQSGGSFGTSVMTPALEMSLSRNQRCGV
jgi:hypothetical protein